MGLGSYGSHTDLLTTSHSDRDGGRAVEGVASSWSIQERIHQSRPSLLWILWTHRGTQEEVSQWEGGDG